MIKIIIFQDFEKAPNKEDFVLQAIRKFKNSKFYDNSIDARRYYRGENTTIMQRLQWFFNGSGQREVDKFKANNRVCSDFFNKIVKQENSYLLGNGVTVDDKIKDNMPRRFDVRIQNAGEEALISGVSWGYCFINSKGNFDIDIWRGDEVVPFYDERTGAIRAVARFWQITTDKPMFVELYEEDGKTEFATDQNGVLQEIEAKTPYKIEKTVDILGETISGYGNFSVLPVFPLWGNGMKRSSLTISLKSKIDLYDIIMSDFGNNLEDAQDVYWVLKNYSGQDMGEFLADYKYYKSIKVEDDGGAEAHTLEVPYEARETALSILRKQIYDGAMALDTSILSGGSLTNVAIKANMMDLDLKTDDFENQVFEFLYNVFDLYCEFANIPNYKYEIELIRRSIVNDTETIDNIYKCRSDISHETAVRLNPYIKNEKEELELVAAEGLSKYSDTEEG